MNYDARTWAPAKTFILDRKMRHNAGKSDNN